MYETANAKRSRRRDVEARIRILVGEGPNAIHWSSDGWATVLGPDGAPYLRVEPTDGRGQQGIRVVRVGEPVRPARATPGGPADPARSQSSLP